MGKLNSNKNLALALLTLGLALLSACPSQNPGFNAYNMVWSTIVIAAPPDKVFAYLADPKTAAEWEENLKAEDITDIQGSGLGSSSHWKADWAGQTIAGKDLVVDYVPNQKLVQKTVCDALPGGGACQQTRTWLLLPEPPGTKLIGMIENTSQTSPTSRIPKESVTQEAFQKLLDGNLQRIKAAVEK